MVKFWTLESLACSRNKIKRTLIQSFLNFVPNQQELIFVGLPVVEVNQSQLPHFFSHWNALFSSFFLKGILPVQTLLCVPGASRLPAGVGLYCNYPVQHSQRSGVKLLQIQCGIESLVRRAGRNGVAGFRCAACIARHQFPSLRCLRPPAASRFGSTKLNRPTIRTQG